MPRGSPEVPPAWQSEYLQTSLFMFKVVNHILWIRIRLLVCESYFVNIFLMRLFFPKRYVKKLLFQRHQKTIFYIKIYQLPVFFFFCICL